MEEEVVEAVLASHTTKNIEKRKLGQGESSRQAWVFQPNISGGEGYIRSLKDS